MSIEERLELQACERALYAEGVRQKYLAAQQAMMKAPRPFDASEEIALIREAISHLSDTTLSASKREQCQGWLKANPDRCVALVGER